MIIRSICYFKTRGERRATKGDKRRRPKNVRNYSHMLKGTLARKKYTCFFWFDSVVNIK